MAKHTLLGETTNNELSSLIAAFELKIFAQVGQHKLDPVDENWTELTITYICIYVYWIATAIGVNFAICSMAMSLFLAVWGQRLAINGPIGSIIRSINMLKPYQITVLKVFTTNVFFLGLSTAFQPFVYQNLQPAFLSCFLTLVSFCTIAHYCLEIYEICYFPNLFHNYSDVDEDAFKKSGHSEVDCFDSAEEHRNARFVSGEDGMHSAEKNQTGFGLNDHSSHDRDTNVSNETASSQHVGASSSTSAAAEEDHFRETINIGRDDADEVGRNPRFLSSLGLFKSFHAHHYKDKATDQHDDL